MFVLRGSVCHSPANRQPRRRIDDLKGPALSHSNSRDRVRLGCTWRHKDVGCRGLGTRGGGCGDGSGKWRRNGQSRAKFVVVLDVEPTARILAEFGKRRIRLRERRRRRLRSGTEGKRRLVIRVR